MTFKLNTQSIETIYEQCRTVLAVLGTTNHPESPTLGYLGHRLHLCGLIDSPKLLVLFHSGADENDRPLHPVLNINAESEIHAYRPVWLSEVDAGTGTDLDPSLPWTDWLSKAYAEACEIDKEQSEGC